MNNPWCSVIIPAYNCRDTIERLLTSIVIQEDNDIEVIICDDWSTDNFMERVEPYKKDLNIIYCKTKPREIHCPSNTRFDGWKYAKGEWITFIDNDDMFEPKAFFNIKCALESSKEKHVIFSEIIGYDTTQDKIVKLIRNPPISLCHGHWYNRQWLIDEGIDFKENMTSYEDVYFNNLVVSVLHSQAENITIVSNKTYRWMLRDGSISDAYRKDKRKFAEEQFSNYNASIYDPWINSYKKYHPKHKDQSFKMLCCVILHLYFHSQYIAFVDRIKEIKPEIFNIIKNDILSICETYECTVQDINNYIHNDIKLYFDSRDEVVAEFNKFIETTTLYDLLNSILSQLDNNI